MIVTDETFVRVIHELAEQLNQNSHDKGFWEDISKMRYIMREAPAFESRLDVMVIAEKIALMHSELSEALEIMRKDRSTPDEKCPEFSNFEIELADAVIRILEMCHEYNLRIGRAILAKAAYNKTRPYKHGKQC